MIYLLIVSNALAELTVRCTYGNEQFPKNDFVEARRYGTPGDAYEQVPKLLVVVMGKGVPMGVVKRNPLSCISDAYQSRAIFT